MGGGLLCKFVCVLVPMRLVIVCCIICSWSLYYLFWSGEFVIVDHVVVFPIQPRFLFPFVFWKFCFVALTVVVVCFRAMMVAVMVDCCACFSKLIEGFCISFFIRCRSIGGLAIMADSCLVLIVIVA